MAKGGAKAAVFVSASMFSSLLLAASVNPVVPAAPHPPTAGGLTSASPSPVEQPGQSGSVQPGQGGNQTGPDEDPNLGLDGPVELPNFHVVSPGEIYRSAQPNRKGIARLARGSYPDAPLLSNGQRKPIKSVLNLRNIGGPEADFVQEEMALEKSLGIQTFSVSMNGNYTPTFQEMDQAIEILADSANQPILVHCVAGKDRTGFAVAAYRVLIDKMDIDQAVAEAKSFGCCTTKFTDLTLYLQQYLQYRQAAGPLP